jgi:secretion/DNA translocation related TadE-like protein
MTGSEPIAERGSGTVLMLLLVFFSGFLVVVGSALANAILVRHRVAAAADLAALAAAGGPPGPVACEQAQRVAAANQTRLVRCQPLGDGSVVVGVERAIGGRGLFGLSGTVRAQARAAPAVPDPGSRVRSLPTDQAGQTTRLVTVSGHCGSLE